MPLAPTASIQHSHLSFPARNLTIRHVLVEVRDEVQVIADGLAWGELSVDLEATPSGELVAAHDRDSRSVYTPDELRALATDGGMDRVDRLIARAAERFGRDYGAYGAMADTETPCRKTCCAKSGIARAA